MERRGEFQLKETPYLVAALGNPGPEYEHTRHNVGFMLADFFAERASMPVRWRDWNGLGRYFEAEIGGKKVFFLKPGTYMNLSGQAVKSLADFYKVPPTGVLAVYDDMSLPLGVIRIRRDGSSGGHKGVASIINVLGASAARLKIGIGPKPERVDASNFVLARFSPAEEKVLAAAFERALNALTAIFEGGLDAAMNLFNYDKPVS